MSGRKQAANTEILTQKIIENCKIENFMRIILQQDISTLGQKLDIKEVRDGYARNFLFPKGLAKPATKNALDSLAMQKIKEEKRKTDEKTMYQKIAETISALTLHFKVKVGEKGKAFGSVTAVKIRDELKKQKIDVEKDWIELEGPIKTIGEKTVKIKFPCEITGEIKVAVEAE